MTGQNLDASWSVIFDLDGTLIDSYPDIADCLLRAFKETEVAPEKPLTRRLIGPVLSDLVAHLAPQASEPQRSRVIEIFRALYDSSPYSYTRPMPGADDLLSALWENGVATYIATNKVEKPTLRILEHLNWGRFKDVVSSDSVPGTRLDKPRLLNALSRRWTLDPLTTWVLGDSSFDILAARLNGFHSAAYGAGYGDLEALRSSQPDIWLNHLQDFTAHLAPQRSGVPI